MHVTQAIFDALVDNQEFDLGRNGGEACQDIREFEAEYDDNICTTVYRGANVFLPRRWILALHYYDSCAILRCNRFGAGLAQCQKGIHPDGVRRYVNELQRTFVIDIPHTVFPPAIDGGETEQDATDFLRNDVNFQFISQGEAVKTMRCCDWTEETSRALGPLQLDLPRTHLDRFTTP